MNKKNLKILNIGLILGGLLIIGTGIFRLIANSKFEEIMISTTATVEKVERYNQTNIDGSNDESFIVYIEYSVGNTIYHNKYKAPRRVESGSTKTIYYNKNNPNEIALGKEYISGVTSIILGMVFLALGLYLYHQRRVY